MAGSLRQRGEGSWQLRVHVGRDPETGRKRYAERTFHGTKRQAERALAALVAESESMSPAIGSSHTVERLLTEWLDLAGPSLSPRTVVVTKGYIDKAIVPAIGSIPVSRLTTVEIDRFYRQLAIVGGPRRKYSPATIRRVHGILRRALSQGVRWGWIRQNPAVEASPPRVPLRELKPPTPGEVAKLFRIAQESDPTLAMFVVLAASTGARRGEVLALRWSDVELEKSSVSIERGLVLAGDQLIEQGTKTHQSRRVALDGSTMALLRAHRGRMEELAPLCDGNLAADAFVLSASPNGSVPLRPDSTTRAFRALCEKASVKGVRLHDLRHYVATRLLGAGVDVRTVAGRLGHRNPSTTLNVYAHFLPEADRQAAEALGQLFDAALGETSSRT
ncbi:MAG: tyrosine-type recombinase/integrase [Acidimicrobiales bacterium]